jgi:hypothetical protein
MSCKVIKRKLEKDYMYVLIHNEIARRREVRHATVRKWPRLRCMTQIGHVPYMTWFFFFFFASCFGPWIKKWCMIL